LKINKASFAHGDEAATDLFAEQEKRGWNGPGDSLAIWCGSIEHSELRSLVNIEARRREI